MANRRRYKDVERILTQALLAETAVFILFMIFAGVGVVALKVITAVLVGVTSALALGFLYMCGEMFKRRSRWLVFGFASLLILLLVSLILNYPSPNVAKAAADMITGGVG